jgi:hypothetical protein
MRALSQALFSFGGCGNALFFSLFRSTGARARTARSPQRTLTTATQMLRLSLRSQL